MSREFYRSVPVSCAVVVGIFIPYLGRERSAANRGHGSESCNTTCHTEYNAAEQELRKLLVAAKLPCRAAFSAASQAFSWRTPPNRKSWVYGGDDTAGRGTHLNYSERHILRRHNERRWAFRNTLRRLGYGLASRNRTSGTFGYGPEPLPRQLPLAAHLALSHLVEIDFIRRLNGHSSGNQARRKKTRKEAAQTT